MDDDEAADREMRVAGVAAIMVLITAAALAAVLGAALAAVLL